MMEKLIKQYKGLSKRELTLAYNRVRTGLTRAANKAAMEAESQLSSEEIVSQSDLKKLEKLDREMDALQTELDTIGLLKVGRFC